MRTTWNEFKIILWRLLANTAGEPLDLIDNISFLIFRFNQIFDVPSARNLLHSRSHHDHLNHFFWRRVLFSFDARHSVTSQTSKRHSVTRQTSKRHRRYEDQSQEVRWKKRRTLLESKFNLVFLIAVSNSYNSFYIEPPTHSSTHDHYCLDHFNNFHEFYNSHTFYHSNMFHHWFSVHESPTWRLIKQIV